MRKVLTFLTILIALVAVTVPSVAISSRAFAAEPAPMLLLEPQGHYVCAKSLLSGGSSRALLCRPDMGVLPVAVFLSPPPSEPVPPVLTDSLPPDRAIAPGLPPPRHA